MTSLFHNIILLTRQNKQLLLVFFDSINIISVLYLSFSLRLGYLFWPQSDLFWLIFGSPLVAIPIFFLTKVYRVIIRYIGLGEIWSIAQAVSLYALMWGVIAFMTDYESIPRSVVLINWLSSFVVIAGSRLFARKLLIEINTKNNNILIYGAGSAGRQLSNALIESKELNPVAFIDDNPDLHGLSINGLRVYSCNELNWLIQKKNIKEALIAIPSLSVNRRKEIISYFQPFPLLVRSLPGVSQIAQGKIKVNDLLEIDIRELLGRKIVVPNSKLLETNIHNKIVLVTGAGGSIGSELCHQIAYLKPKKLILFDISEYSLYLIEQKLKIIHIPDLEIYPIIGSILDKERLESIFNRFGVQTVYHAAAYKHVPLVESNASQGVLNNTIGTLRIAEAAISSKVETFVLISTDKAVRPTNIMGASKRAAELILQAFSDDNLISTCFTTVRFGNVLDSSGSVIPLFKKQIKAGGPVTVTHVDIVRYFMTIPESVELVIQAGAMAKGGEVFVLDMGKPVRIYDLATKMIQLSGLTLKTETNPKGDIEIQYIGLRPGEKLYEELLVNDSSLPTEHPLIMSAEEVMITWDQLEPRLTEISKAAINSETQKIYELLIDLIPEYKPSSNSLFK
jgi:FlaA1/EpsC-like NDP-sugar epimerase